MELDEYWSEEGAAEMPNFECPLCGAEVEESGLCNACKDATEDDDD